MRYAGLLATGALFVAMSAPAAEEREHLWLPYVGALGTLGKPDQARGNNTRDSVGLELLYGRQRDNGWGYEFNGYTAVIETGANQGTDFYRWGAGGDLIYALGDRLHLTPFVLVGVAYGRNDVIPSDKKAYDWTGNAGIGAVTKALLWDEFRLRGELRYIYDDYGRKVGSRGFGDWQLGLGLEFGPRVAPPPPPVVVEERVRVVEVAAPEKDSDGDGIPDSKDDCPDTPSGTRVDQHGCALPKILRLNGVTFEFDKARLRPDARTILKEVAQILARYPDMEVEIAGHTDGKGTQEYNLKLSQRRAEAVRNHLIALGIKGERITAVGYGKSQPIDSNTTDAGREVNRRVEMRVKN